MATNFSPCKGSYVLNQFPSNVMFGMNGFHVSASGAIQGHHGPLVIKKTWLKWLQFIFTLWTRRDSFNFFFSETFEANMAIFWGLLSSLQT